MATLIKGTHGLFKTLQNGGLSDEQSEAPKVTFDRVGITKLATKNDIKYLRIEFYKITAIRTLIINGAMVTLAQAL